MIDARHVLLVWASLLLVPWGAFFWLCRRCRRAMVWASLFAVPFGFSEVLFAGSYWSPPTLFDLARRVHLDVESFVFLFGAGGVAAVIYDVVTGRGAPADRATCPARSAWSREAHRAGLAAPALVFSPALMVWHEPICAGIVAMGVGVIARLACRPDLAAKTLVGGLLFLVLYAALLASLARLEPGYIARVWSDTGAPRARVAGIPVCELAFGGAFGAFWSGLYEHYRWTFRHTSWRSVAGREDDGPPADAAIRRPVHGV